MIKKLSLYLRKQPKSFKPRRCLQHLAQQICIFQHSPGDSTDIFVHTELCDILQRQGPCLVINMRIPGGLNTLFLLSNSIDTRIHASSRPHGSKQDSKGVSFSRFGSGGLPCRKANKQPCARYNTGRSVYDTVTHMCLLDLALCCASGMLEVE